MHCTRPPSRSIFDDPYQYIKAPGPFAHLNMINTPENPIGIQASFFYIQNVAPDGGFCKRRLRTAAATAAAVAAAAAAAVSSSSRAAACAYLR